MKEGALPVGRTPGYTALLFQILFYRQYIIVDRLSAHMDINIHVRIELFYSLREFLCILLTDILSVIETDQFRIFITRRASMSFVVSSTD